MATEKRLIDANALAKEFLLMPGHYRKAEIELIHDAPTVDAYTEEQVAQIIKQEDKLAAKANELEKEVVWLKSCLNCKIRKECSRHCGKVVHNCDYWEYGDNAVEVVRCKGCKHYWKNVNTPGYSGKCTMVNDDDFCSHGERKDK